MSVGDARPFWTACSTRCAIAAISSRSSPRRNSSFAAERVATDTAADDPSPADDGIWLET